jgi:hypothetical protein
MQDLALSAYESLRAGAQVLEADKHGDKVLRLADGNFLKLFRRKRLISSAALYPYAQRFADNAGALQRLQIPCPQIIGVYRVPEISRDAVHYHPLPGLTLRQLIAGDTGKLALRSQLGAFISKLHDSGVYFRSLHLGNIVETPEGELGLIDISDMRTQSRSLGKRQRQRNFRHMLRYPADREWLLKDGGEALAAHYLHGSAGYWSYAELLRLLSLDP